MSDNSFRQDGGQFDRVYDNDDFISAILERGGKGDTVSIANAVGASRRHTHKRLTELEERGVVIREKVGNSLEWTIGDVGNNKCSESIQYISNKLSESPPSNLDSTHGMVIAIRAPHSQSILNEQKHVEFRRSKFKEANLPEVAFIYEPSPTQAIVGVFSIESFEVLPIRDLKRLAQEQPTSTSESIEQYFEGKDEGTAIFIEQAETIDPPIHLNDCGAEGWAFTPPQNFYYVDPREFLESLKN